MTALFSNPRINPTTVPDVPVEIVPAHPLAPARLYLLSLWRELVVADQMIGSKSVPFPTFGITPAGPAGYFGGSNYMQMSGNGPLLGPLPAWTIVALVQTSSAGVMGAGSTLYCERGSSGNDILKFILTGPGSNQTGPGIVYRNDSGTLVNDGSVSIVPTMADGNVHSVGAVYVSSAAGFQFWTDGAMLRTEAWGSNNAFTNPGLIRSIGVDAGAGTGYYTGNLMALWLYNSALPATQMAWLAREPFAMLRPVVRRSFVTAQAAAVPGRRRQYAAVLA